MKQSEEIRKRLNQYILNNGVSAKFISCQVGLHESTLSRFRKDKVELYPETLDAIKKYLDSKQA